MKQYPSILNSSGKNFREFTAYVFDKIDGSNLRFEWSKKRGWYKFGTRNRLFDRTDEVFGCAVDLFLNTLAPEVEHALRKHKNLQSIVVFAEFAGENSFAGQHTANDEKKLYLFDAAINKKGLMGPKEFLDTFSNVTNRVLYIGTNKWNRTFIEDVKSGAIKGVTFEGVVGKFGEGHKLIMAKAKTQKWIDKVRALYHPNEAERIINS